NIGHLVVDQRLKPEELLLHPGQGRLRVVEEHLLEVWHVFLQSPRRLAGLAEIGGGIAGLAAPAIVRGNAGQTRSPVGLIAGEQHAVQLLLNSLGGPRGERLEGGDLACAHVQLVARLGVGEGLGLVGGKGELGEVGHAPLSAELTVCLDLFIRPHQLPPPPPWRPCWLLASRAAGAPPPAAICLASVSGGVFRKKAMAKARPRSEPPLMSTLTTSPAMTLCRSLAESPASVATWAAVG